MSAGRRRAACEHRLLQSRHQRRRDPGDDLVLDREEVLGGDVEALAPGLRAARRIRRGRRRSRSRSSGPAQASLRSTWVTPRRSPISASARSATATSGARRHHLQRREAAELARDVLDQSLGDQRLVPRVARGLERQDDQDRVPTPHRADQSRLQGAGVCARSGGRLKRREVRAARLHAAVRPDSRLTP